MKILVSIVLPLHAQQKCSTCNLDSNHVDLSCRFACSVCSKRALTDDITGLVFFRSLSSGLMSMSDAENPSFDVTRKFKQRYATSCCHPGIRHCQDVGVPKKGEHRWIPAAPRRLLTPAWKSMHQTISPPSVNRFPP